MVRCPRGFYLLGTRYNGLEALTPPSAPEHQIEVVECFIDAHEVTNGEFQKFVDHGAYARDDYWVEARGVDRSQFRDATGRPGPAFWRDGRFADGEGHLPVVGVSWYEAAAYARWAGKRLPTEAE